MKTTPKNRLINQSTRDVGRKRVEFVNQEPQASGLRILRVFFQHPKWFISLQTIETCGLLLLHNNSEDAPFFYELTGTAINHSRLTNQSARIDLVII